MLFEFENRYVNDFDIERDERCKPRCFCSKEGVWFGSQFHELHLESALKSLLLTHNLSPSHHLMLCFR